MMYTMVCNIYMQVGVWLWGLLIGLRIEVLAETKEGIVFGVFGWNWRIDGAPQEPLKIPMHDLIDQWSCPTWFHFEIPHSSNTTYYKLKFRPLVLFYFLGKKKRRLKNQNFVFLFLYKLNNFSSKVLMLKSCH